MHRKQYVFLIFDVTSICNVPAGFLFPPNVLVRAVTKREQSSYGTQIPMAYKSCIRQAK